MSGFVTRQEAVYTAAGGLPFPHPIPSRDRVMDTWEELIKHRALDGLLSIADTPRSDGSWPLQW